MGKANKKTVKYIGGKLPQNLGELLNNADEGDLRILTALLMAANSEGEVPEDFSLCEVLGIDVAAADASLKFWRGAGVIGTTTRKSTPQTEQKEKKETQSKLPSAHRSGVLDGEERVSGYRTGELAQVLEQRDELRAFVDEAQRVFGKTFNTYDTQIVVGIVDRLGLETQAVLTILAYAKSVGKSTLRYCEKFAMALYDEGYTTAEEIMHRIAQIEKSKELEGEIRTLFGMGSRALTKSEKTLFSKWSDTYGYGIDIIRLAYDRTVDNIHEPSPKYLNAILEKWHAEGLHTEADILEHEKGSKKAKEAKTGTKSYELDEFLDAALKRGYEDLD